MVMAHPGSLIDFIHVSSTHTSTLQGLHITCLASGLLFPICFCLKCCSNTSL